MNIAIPSAEQVRTELKSLQRRQIKRLGDLSGVSWHTIYKISRGEITQPALDTVRAILPHIEAAKQEVSHAAGR